MEPGKPEEGGFRPEAPTWTPTFQEVRQGCHSARTSTGWRMRYAKVVPAPAQKRGADRGGFHGIATTICARQESDLR